MVVDPIQSVKGKVVIDAFRLINPQAVLTGQQTRQTTSNVGHLQKPSIQALIHGLNRSYYSMAINYRKNELEQAMLMNLHKKKWTTGLKVESFESVEKQNSELCDQMLKSAVTYNKAIQEERTLSKEEKEVAFVGKVDPKKRLASDVESLMGDNIVQSLGTMLDAVIFSADN